MSSSVIRRFILPFSPTKTSEPMTAEVETAAVYALAELDRTKGNGLFVKQPEEKILFTSKMGYPLWLFPKAETTYLFDGFDSSNYTVNFAELPSAKAFMESLELSSRTKEEFMTFLSDHSNYFRQPGKQRRITLKNLIVEADLREEFDTYRKEATEIAVPPTNFALIPPMLEENTISGMLTEMDATRASVKEESYKLPEIIRFLNRTADEFVTELDYAAEAVKDETAAKIKAQEEFINPKIESLNKEYKKRITNLTRSFDDELERLQKQKGKTETDIQGDQEKITQYQREAQIQAAKKHLVYEKRWKEKTSETKKELSGLNKEFRRIEKNIVNLRKQRTTQITALQVQLEEKIKSARQPLRELEADRDAKVLVIKEEAQALIKKEKPMTEAIYNAIKIQEGVTAKFEVLGFKDSRIKSPTLFYIPFYMTCYQTGLSRRYSYLVPSSANPVSLSTKLKGAFGKAKIRELFSPRFQSISGLIDKVLVIARHDYRFEAQIADLGEKNSLLKADAARSLVVEGLAYLKDEGWLSEKEHKILRESLR